MKDFAYDRYKSVDYAKRYALNRNGKYLNFDALGGDCTNFCSQCLYEGAPKMNYNKITGWYYINGNNKAAAWTDVEYFYKFITTNKGFGPYGREVFLFGLEEGDFVQLSFDGIRFQHSVVITKISEPPIMENIRIACHTYDRLDYPLSDFFFTDIRYIHIDGYRA